MDNAVCVTGHRRYPSILGLKLANVWFGSAGRLEGVNLYISSFSRSGIGDDSSMKRFWRYWSSLRRTTQEFSCQAKFLRKTLTTIFCDVLDLWLGAIDCFENASFRKRIHRSRTPSITGLKLTCVHKLAQCSTLANRWDSLAITELSEIAKDLILTTL